MFSMRYDSEINGRGVAILESAPTVRGIFLDHTRLHLSFPWLVFVVKYHHDNETGHFVFDSLQMGFRNASLRTMTDAVGTPLLPNMVGKYGYDVCMPTNFQRIYETVNDVFAGAMNNFWDSEFTNINQGNIRHMEATDERVASFPVWAASSKESPDFILDISWVGPLTLSEIAGCENSESLAP